MFAVGDTVRLYAIPGTFSVCSVQDDRAIPLITVERDGERLFDSPQSSVVEHNGHPMPLRSCPLTHPALDYPHEPTFDYSDGPQLYAEDAMHIWRQLRK